MHVVTYYTNMCIYVCVCVLLICISSAKLGGPIWLVPLYNHEDFHRIHAIGNTNHAPP